MTEAQKQTLNTFLDAWIKYDEARKTMNALHGEVGRATTAFLRETLRGGHPKPTIVRDGKAYTLRPPSTHTNGEIEVSTTEVI